MPKTPQRLLKPHLEFAPRKPCSTSKLIKTRTVLVREENEQNRQNNQNGLKVPVRSSLIHNIFPKYQENEGELMPKSLTKRSILS